MIDVDLASGAHRSADYLKINPFGQVPVLEDQGHIISDSNAILLIYFRLVRTLGSIGVTSQSYSRSGIGVLLGVLVLGERFSLPIAFGLAAAVSGVLLIN